MDGSQVAVSVRPFRPGDEHRWDQFVCAHLSGTFFHLSGWKRVIERAFGHRTYYLIAERGPIRAEPMPRRSVEGAGAGSPYLA